METLKERKQRKKLLARLQVAKKPKKTSDTYYSDLSVLKHLVKLTKAERNTAEPVTLANFYFKDETSRHCFNYLFYYCRHAQIVIKKATTPTIIKPYSFIQMFIDEYSEQDYLSIVFLAIAETSKLKYFTDKQKHVRNRKMVSIVRKECRTALNYKKVVYQRHEPLQVQDEDEKETTALDLLSSDGGLDALIDRLYLQQLLESLTEGEKMEIVNNALSGKKIAHISRIRKKLSKTRDN